MMIVFRSILMHANKISRSQLQYFSSQNFFSCIRRSSIESRKKKFVCLNQTIIVLIIEFVQEIRRSIEKTINFFQRCASSFERHQKNIFFRRFEKRTKKGRWKNGKLSIRFPLIVANSVIESRPFPFNLNFFYR